MAVRTEEPNSTPDEFDISAKLSGVVRRPTGEASPLQGESVGFDSLADYRLNQELDTMDAVPPPDNAMQIKPRLVDPVVEGVLHRVITVAEGNKREIGQVSNDIAEIRKDIKSLKFWGLLACVTLVLMSIFNTMLNVAALAKEARAFERATSSRGERLPDAKD